MSLGPPSSTRVRSSAASDVYESKVLINEVPLIFRKEIYALACVIGGLVYYACYHAGLTNVAAGIVCGASVMLTRFLAVKYHLSLPVLKSED